MRIGWLLLTLLGCSGAMPAPSAAVAGPAVEDGWQLSGNAHDAFAVRADATESHDGHATVHLFKMDPVATGYGTYLRVLDPAAFRGKRVRISAWVKTVGTSRRADFWARVQAADSPRDGPGLGGHWTRLGEGSEWTLRQIVLDVPSAGASLQYGVGIDGPGELWMDPWPKVESVGADVAVTGAFDGEQSVGDWIMTGVGAADYGFAQDGDAVRLDPRTAETKRFVHALRRVQAESWIGKPLRITFEVKMPPRKTGACVVKVLESPEWTYGPSLRDDFKPQTGTGSFVTCELETEAVPAGAKWILYGVAPRGAGSAWARGGSIQ